ncbi:DNA-binding transcriptional activator of the SARP family [Cribrihabitans marinus]|uniref:DNA-binding transcriptional activator of the SARP family n=1 Tax=Cribrihabitans marinus TaxID=1227549 RepID=A0A1H7DHM6_9RHOB|nr:BTAD domain-containing putative transcriptional regulator [Cribrihabitans marinus]GGH37972.1 trifolitoxin synthesis, TfuA [Cribrihabitans marinus]SEJ97705.1 DNA-binding transcriptional activator of the SARP family [Cribrihabitans marinus]
MTQVGFRLQVLGPVRLFRGGVEITPRSAAARILLAYLALSTGGREDRQRLATLLWENSDEGAARHNLRQTLHKVGQASGSRWPVLTADRGTVALAGQVRSDLYDVLREMESGQVPEALQSGAALPDRLLGAEPHRGELFETWLKLQRQSYLTRLQAALDTCLAGSDEAVGLNAAETMLAIEPADERAARHLMEHHYHAGRTARALDVYARLWTHLDETYDTEPDGETQALVVAIKTAAPLRPAPQPARQRDVALRIALGRTVAVGDATVDSVARLVRAEMAATLMRFRTFRVVDRDYSADAADYVLDLSVGMVSGELLLLAVLTAEDTGTVSWSDRWQGLGENWLATQATVISRIAAALSLGVSRERLRHLSRVDFGSRAFDAWLQGNMQLDRFDAQGLTRADQCFRRVIDLAPDASIGYSSLARLKNGQHLMLPGHVRRDEEHISARDLATRAIALDPLDTRAHLHRAWAHCLLGEHAKAATGFHIARECNPNDPWTMLSSALGAAFGGDLDLATDLSRQVVASGWTTEPFQWGFHAPIRFLAGDMEGCIAACEACGTAIVNVPGWQAAALWHQARPAEAQAAWSEFAHLARQRWIWDDVPDDAALAAWFRSLFPLADPDQRARLGSLLKGAAGL